MIKTNHSICSCMEVRFQKNPGIQDSLSGFFLSWACHTLSLSLHHCIGIAALCWLSQILAVTCCWSCCTTALVAIAALWLCFGIGGGFAELLVLLHNVCMQP